MRLSTAYKQTAPLKEWCLATSSIRSLRLANCLYFVAKRLFPTRLRKVRVGQSPKLALGEAFVLGSRLAEKCYVASSFCK